MRRYILIFISLFSGLIMYLGFRNTHTPIYHWAINLGLGSEISLMRNTFQSIHLPDWIVYSLPDGLWMFSFVLTVLSIWNFNLDKTNRIWIFSAISIGLGFELMQGFVKGMGVFDWKDLSLMIIGALAALAFAINKQGDEKSLFDNKSIKINQRITRTYLTYE